MRCYKAQLVQFIELRAEHNKNIKHKVLKVYNRFTHSNLNVPFVVPPLLPPSNLPFCGIISVSYAIEYVIDPGIFSTNLTDQLEVIIGTVPLYNSATVAPEPEVPIRSNQHIEFEHCVTPNRQGVKPTDPTSTPPPSYEEYLQAKENNQIIDGVK